MPWRCLLQIFSPRARSSASTVSMPFLSMVRSAWVDTRSFTQRFSLGTQKRRSCRFGSQRRRVLLLACDTLLPDSARLPVIWQTLAIVPTSRMGDGAALGQDGFGPADAGIAPRRRGEPHIT